jgi:mannosyl-oligosaccharide alpha-1,2-mannosidase
MNPVLTFSGAPLIDARNILRPETVESLFLAYRATGDEQYREAGWRIFEAFQEHCRLDEGGYAGIEDVRDLPVKRLDGMETFWIGETLSESPRVATPSGISENRVEDGLIMIEYLYLLFDDSSNIPLDKYVFNTEAHILPIFQPTHLSEFATS